MISEDPGFDIRYTNRLDFGALERWLQEEAVHKWMSLDSEAEIRAFASNWIYFSRFKSSITATLNSDPIGIATLFLMPFKKVSHMAALYIVVDPKYQRKGVGSSLVKNAKHLAENYFKLEHLYFEGFGESPAIPLVAKAGFEQVFVQEDYFHRDGKFYPRTMMEVRFGS